MKKFLTLILSSLLVFFINQAQAADFKELEQEISDSVITAKITAKFTRNQNLNPLKISVSTVNNEVKLSGYVKNKQALVDALRLTKNTRGVKRVDTEDLHIKKVNTALTDAYITAKVETAVLKAKVLDDESIPIVGINATTCNGIVTLEGSVKSHQSISAIIKRVSEVRGVKKVISNMDVEKEKLENDHAL